MLIKTAEDIEQLKKGGKILGEILEKLALSCKSGVKISDLDIKAEEMILSAGGRPAFKNYTSHRDGCPFPSTICASLNEELVHGSGKRAIVLREGDILGIDIGMEWPCLASGAVQGKSIKKRGLYTDTAMTVIIGKPKKGVQELLDVTKEALEKGIEAVKPGNSVADIGRAIEDYVKSQGKYGIVRDLVGHGVGHAVHEEPHIPNYYDPSLKNFILRPGMVLALEPMISMGGHRVRTADDGWTIEMADKSLCAHFEHTVVVTEKGCEVATRRPSEL